MYYRYLEPSNEHMIIGFIIHLIGILIAVALVFWLMKSTKKNHLIEKDATQDESIMIARKRYATGEIDKKEFEQIKTELAE